MSKIAVGCSHTYGVGVDKSDAWPNLLGAINLGVPGISSDHIARNITNYLNQYNPSIVYVLWPEWTRFEYCENNQIRQSLPSDPDRIFFMETATDDWLKENFINQTNIVKEKCKRIKLVELTLYDLIPFIDHADTWPISKLGHHYNEEWHSLVANIFKNQAEWITDHRLFV